jgi:hypothetical protein
MAIDELAPGSSQTPGRCAGGTGSGCRGDARPQGERMTILGIDPGKSGAVAVVDEGGWPPGCGAGVDRRLSGPT